MSGQVSFWLDLAMRSKKSARIARELGYRENALRELRFARWCMKMDRMFHA